MGSSFSICSFVINKSIMTAAIEAEAAQHRTEKLGADSDSSEMYFHLQKFFWKGLSSKRGV